MPRYPKQKMKYAGHVATLRREYNPEQNEAVRMRLFNPMDGKMI
jgi:hypothetical protein